jgi:hypothetical protein
VRSATELESERKLLDAWTSDCPEQIIVDEHRKMKANDEVRCAVDPVFAEALALGERWKAAKSERERSALTPAMTANWEQLRLVNSIIAGRNDIPTSGSVGGRSMAQWHAYAGRVQRAMIEARMSRTMTSVPDMPQHTTTPAAAPAVPAPLPELRPLDRLAVDRMKQIPEQFRHYINLRER